jgi:hypothetical protein
MGVSALWKKVSPVLRCLTAIATSPWWAAIRGWSFDSNEESEPQRHRDTEKKRQRGMGEPVWEKSV